MRVAIFDDQQWMIDAIALSMTTAGFDVVLTARTGMDLLADLDPGHLPDVVILDKRTAVDESEGLTVAGQLRAEYPNVGIVLISAHLHAADVSRLMDLPGDALGVIGKDAISDHSTLTRIVDAVGLGARFVDRSAGASTQLSGEQKLALDSLTPRQEQTLELMAQMLSNAQVAERLGAPGKPLSERAVETYASELYRRLGLNHGRQNRMHAIAIWLASGRKSRS